MTSRRSLVLLAEAGFDEDGGARNRAVALFRALGARPAPEAPSPPAR